MSLQLALEECVKAGLSLLLKASDYALDAGCDRWQLAVAIQQLRDVGLPTLDLRWLVCKGYVEHAFEVTLPGEKSRAFRPLKTLSFQKRSCVLLSQAGIDFARTISPSSVAPEPSATPPAAEKAQRPAAEPPARPRWDAEHRKLWFKGQLIKWFRTQAGNQKLLLSAFERAGWAEEIDNPFTRESGDPKRRLLDAVHALNRNQLVNMLRFHTDEATHSRWETISEKSLPSRSG